MSAVDESIFGILSASDAIAALVGTRIYPGDAPQGATFPRIHWGKISEDPDLTHEGRGTSDRSVYEFHCVGRTVESARAVAEAIDQAFAPPARAAAIQVILKDGEFDTSEADASSGDQRIETRIAQYIIRAA